MVTDNFEPLTARESLLAGAEETQANVKIFSSHANALIASLPIFAALSLLNSDSIPNWLVGISITAFGSGFILSFWYISRRTKETNAQRVAIFQALNGRIMYDKLPEMLKDIAKIEKRTTKYLFPMPLTLLLTGFASLCVGAFM